jgi:hypothetical protein
LVSKIFTSIVKDTFALIKSGPSVIISLQIF